jgi:hypothetical protein
MHAPCPRALYPAGQILLEDVDAEQSIYIFSLGVFEISNRCLLS